MIRRSELPYQPRDSENTPPRMAAVYLIGTLGVGTVIALIVILALEAGWVGSVQTTLRHIELPSLPRLAEHDVFPSLNGVTGMQQTTTKLWQRGNANIGAANGGSPPNVGRRD